MFFGLLVLMKKATFLINLVLWNGLSGDPNVIARIFGTFLLIAGFVVVLLPFVLS
jgi:hypothetical protein